MCAYVIYFMVWIVRKSPYVILHRINIINFNFTPYCVEM